MLQTKVEIKLKKAEPGSWCNFELTKVAAESAGNKGKNTKKPLDESVKNDDLSDLS